MARVYNWPHQSVWVRSFGNELEYDPKDHDLSSQLAHIEMLAQQMGAQRLLWQRLANDNHPDGRARVLQYFDGETNKARSRVNHERCDGVVFFKKGDAVAMTSRDCPILVLYSEHEDLVMMLHCSRSSLQGLDMHTPMPLQSVIGNAFAMHPFMAPEAVYGFLTLGIAARHFHNERYPDIIASLKASWGVGVIGGTKERPTIDIETLVRKQVAVQGVDPQRVLPDSLDTFTDMRLASVRAKRGGHNLVIAVHR